MEGNKKETVNEIRKSLWAVVDKLTQEERKLIENPKNLDKEDLRLQLKEFRETKGKIVEIIDNLNYLFQL